MSIDAHKKTKRGRPTVDSEQLRSRLGRPLIERLDQWREAQSDTPSRSEAARRLIELGLKAFESQTVAPKTSGIDDPITLGGRETTLREEYQRGKVTLVRGNLGTHASDGPFAYWAVVRTEREGAERFRISSGDFKLLSGR
jgi:hypothetical protein